MTPKKFFFLSTCSTCRRVMNELDLREKGFEFHDIGKETITEDLLNDWAERLGSYEELLNRRSKRYKELEDRIQELSPEKIKEEIKKDHKLLKRPIIEIDDRLLAGYSRQTLNAAHELLGHESV